MKNRNNGSSKKNSKNYSKGNSRGSKRPISKQEKPEEVGQTKSSDKPITRMEGNNDVAWYSLTPEVLRDAASLPFSNALGNIIDGAAPQSIPGIMQIRYSPTFGVSTSAGSPLNLAAMKLYAFIRQANSGSKNYESTDLMMYVMAVSSIYSTLFLFKRAMGLLNTFSSYNKYLGRALVEAVGFDYDDLVANQADYRRRYNTIVDQINMSLHVPSGFKFMARHGFLNSNVFTDGVGKKFQMYVFVPTFAWKYNATGFATGTALIGDLIPSDATGPVFFDFIDSLIAPLISDEDISIMSGDLLKAYGDGGTEKLGYLEMDYTTPIDYDTLMLAQIHNIQTNQLKASILCSGDVPNPGEIATPSLQYWYCPAPLTGSSNNVNLSSEPVIVQNGNVLYTQGLSAVSYEGNPNGWWTNKVKAHNMEPLLLDVPVDSPTPGDVMESTRLMDYVLDENFITYVGTNGTDKVHYARICYGSEMISNISVFYYDVNGEVKSKYIYGGGLTPSDDPFKNWVYYTSCFDWCPIWIVTSSYENDGTILSVEQRVGDISNYTLVSDVTLQNIHEAATYGLFNVPVLNVSR